jgi:hypothetical protein
MPWEPMGSSARWKNNIPINAKVFINVIAGLYGSIASPNGVSPFHLSPTKRHKDQSWSLLSTRKI